MVNKMADLRMDFLSSGDKTFVGRNVKAMASCIHDGPSRDKIREIMYLMNQRVPLVTNSSTEEKFNRTAEDILQGDLRHRNGCCDSSTLFVALCRAKGIPAMQVITLDLDSVEKKHNFSTGHFFSACFIVEEGDWVWLDSNRRSKSIDDVTFHPFDRNMDRIDERYLIFAKVRDYSDFELDGLRIDSIPNMIRIHQKVYEKYKGQER